MWDEITYPGAAVCTAPTTSQWSTILLPTKVWLISEYQRFEGKPQQKIRAGENVCIIDGMYLMYAILFAQF